MVQEIPPHESAPHLGPEPRWFIYVAALLCGGFFSGLVVQAIEVAFAPPFGEGRGIAIVYTVFVSALDGVIWGVLLAWAVRLKLVFMVPVMLIGTALELMRVATQLWLISTAPDGPGRAALFEGIGHGVLHLAVFWIVCLAIAIPPRRRLARPSSQA